MASFLMRRPKAQSIRWQTWFTSNDRWARPSQIETTSTEKGRGKFNIFIVSFRHENGRNSPVLPTYASISVRPPPHPGECGHIWHVYGEISGFWPQKLTMEELHNFGVFHWRIRLTAVGYAWTGGGARKPPEVYPADLSMPRNVAGGSTVCACRYLHSERPFVPPVEEESKELGNVEKLRS